MVYDAQHALDHTEVAGWALGALDPDDFTDFTEHLRSCAQCQAEVAEFAPVAQSLALAAPAVEPPPDLERKVVAAVQYAVLAESAARPAPVTPTVASVTPTVASAAPSAAVSATPTASAPATLAVTAVTARPEAEGKPSTAVKAHRWWHLHWTNPVLTALAAAAVTAAAFLGTTLLESAPVLAATFTLAPQPGQVGAAAARTVPGGYQLTIDLKHLAALHPGQFYECVYVGPGGELVSGGTFSASNGTVTMQSAANPSEFRVIQIRREQLGADVQHAPVILAGIADTSRAG